jgi:hypothetical protein
VDNDRAKREGNCRTCAKTCTLDEESRCHIRKRETMKNIPQHVINVCKIGQGNDCCRYLAMGSGGFECLKMHLIIRLDLDKRVENQTIVARGDNCEGKSKLEEVKNVEEDTSIRTD